MRKFSYILIICSFIGQSMSIMTQTCGSTAAIATSTLWEYTNTGSTELQIDYASSDNADNGSIVIPAGEKGFVHLQYIDGGSATFNGQTVSMSGSLGICDPGQGWDRCTNSVPFTDFCSSSTAGACISASAGAIGTALCECNCNFSGTYCENSSTGSNCATNSDGNDNDGGTSNGTSNGTGTGTNILGSNPLENPIVVGVIATTAFLLIVSLALFQRAAIVEKQAEKSGGTRKTRKLKKKKKITDNGGMDEKFDSELLIDEDRSTAASKFGDFEAESGFTLSSGGAGRSSMGSSGGGGGGGKRKSSKSAISGGGKKRKSTVGGGGKSSRSTKALDGPIDPSSPEGRFETLLLYNKGFQRALIAGYHDPGKRDPILAAHHLCQVFEANSSAIPFLELVLTDHINACENQSSILRASSFENTLITAYAALVGSKFLVNTLKPALDNILKTRRNTGGASVMLPSMRIELNPNMADDGTIERSKADIEAEAEVVLRAITASKAQIPAQLRGFCFVLRQAVAARYGQEVGRQAVANFILLRFFSPALITPQQKGITSHTIGANTQRTLLLITKILQALASDVPLGTKESYMGIVEGFRKEKRPLMIGFLDAISAPLTTEEAAKTVARIQISKKEALVNLLAISREHKAEIQKFMEKSTTEAVQTTWSSILMGKQGLIDAEAIKSVKSGKSGKSKALRRVSGSTKTKRFTMETTRKTKKLSASMLPDMDAMYSDSHERSSGVSKMTTTSGITLSTASGISIMPHEVEDTGLAELHKTKSFAVNTMQLELLIGQTLEDESAQGTEKEKGFYQTIQTTSSAGSHRSSTSARSNRSASASSVGSRGSRGSTGRKRRSSSGAKKSKHKRKNSTSSRNSSGKRKTSTSSRSKK